MQQKPLDHDSVRINEAAARPGGTGDIRTGADFRTPASPAAGTPTNGLVATLRRLQRERRGRRKFFDAGLLGEPAWDMLLELQLAERGGDHLSTSSLCLGAGVPLTTGLRWLNVLEESGLLRRELDTHDRRCQLVCLTDQGRRAFQAYVSSISDPETQDWSSDAANGQNSSSVGGPS